MNLIILASVIALAVAISVFGKRSSNEAQKQMEEFWDKERRANFVRKKPLDNLNYISIPDNFYNITFDKSDSRVCDAVDNLLALKDAKIVNFSGISNTDLKLEYGTANLPILSEYDYNYTMLSRSLQVLAESLYKAGNYNDCRSILEFAISTGSDMAGNYKLLANIYKDNNLNSELSNLRDKAEAINGLMKTAILEHIDELISSCTNQQESNPDI